MYRNFIRISCANAHTRLLDPVSNGDNIIKTLDFAIKNHIDIINFPELSICGLSAGEMIKSREILKRSQDTLLKIAEFTKGNKILLAIGLPLEYKGQILSAQAIIQDGQILSYIAKERLNKDQKTYLATLSNNSEIEEKIREKLIFEDENSKTRLAFIFEDDLFESSSTYGQLIENNINALFVIGSKNENADLLNERKEILKSLSKKDHIAIAYSGPSIGESSTNAVYSGQRLIIEDGKILEESSLFQDGLSYTEINIDQVKSSSANLSNTIETTKINFEEQTYSLKRKMDPHPLIPSDKDEFAKKAKNILNIQAHALIRRLNQLGDKKVFLGLSGGLDSTQALIVACYTYELLGIDKKDIHAILMPGLGTSTRTKSNAQKLAESYGVSVQTIDITQSVMLHFKDLDHDPEDHSIVFENAQARERTQILMDLSNKHGGIVLGTGNMSEIALGFATYNGDHMSMYAINAGLTKTLLREVVRFVKDQTQNPQISEPLSDILDTPISPELLPPMDDQIAQKTEDNVGPYELHDFFLYHTIRNKSAFSDVLFMCYNAFEGKYSNEEIQKWYKTFLRRFSTQQFKRSCMPDGPQIEDFSLSPRNGFIMASDIEILNWEEK